MKNITKTKLHKIIYPIIEKAGLKQIKPEWTQKIVEGYIKFLDITFKIISSITISLVFLWFLPKYLKLSDFQTLTILLLTILLYLKNAKIKVELED